MTPPSERVASIGRSAVRGQGIAGRALLGGLAIAALVVPLLAWRLGLDERITHWGKFVHGVEGFVFALFLAMLLLAWRDRERVGIPDQLAALLTMFAGVVFGVAWEVGEFVRDWSLDTDVQKSNSDTMSDFVWHDFGVILGAVLATRLYCHWLVARQRDELGDVSVWLVGGPSHVLAGHGMLIALVVSIVAAAGVLAVWFAGRTLPGFGVS